MYSNIFSYTYMVYEKGPSYTYTVYETEKLIYLYCIRKNENVLMQYNLFIEVNIRLEITFAHTMNMHGVFIKLIFLSLKYFWL